MDNDRNEVTAGTALRDAEIIDRFGGIRPMATKLGVAFTTVQGWKVRGHIPEGRRQAILDAAGKHGIDLGAATPADPPTADRKAKRAPVKETPTPEPPREKPGQTETPAGETPGAAKPGPEPAAAPVTAPPPAAPPLAAPPPAAPARRNAGIAWLSLLAALAVGVALIARPWWEPLIYQEGPVPGGSALSGETVTEIRVLSQAVDRLSSDLAGRLDALEDRIDAVERTGGGSDLGPQLAALERSLASLAGGLESISATLSGLEARIVALESMSAAVPAQIESALRENAAAVAALKEKMATQEHMTTLRARVGELESRPVQTGEKIAALALAVGQVEAAFDSGRPYRSALNRLEAIARDDPLVLEGGAIAALSPWADRGIDSRAALRRRFAEIAPDITGALAKSDSVTWIDRIWDSVSTVVTVRRVDGSDPVSRAEAALANDDLADAVAALKGLGSLGEDGDAWLAMAEQRIRAEEEIAALYARVILPLAGPETATPAPDAGSRESATQ